MQGGSFTTKIFQGVGIEELIIAIKPYFSDVRRFSPMASRNSSSEVYIVCRNYMPWVKRDESIRSNYERLLDIKLNPEEEIDEEKVYTSFKLRKKK